MKQEENKSAAIADGFLNVLDLIQQGRVADFKIEFSGTLVNVNKIQTENEQLKAKLEKACEALRFYGDGNLTISMESENGPYYIEECQVTSGDFSLGSRARAALKQIEGEL